MLNIFATIKNWFKNKFNAIFGRKAKTATPTAKADSYTKPYGSRPPSYEAPKKEAEAAAKVEENSNVNFDMKDVAPEGVTLNEVKPADVVNPEAPKPKPKHSEWLEKREAALKELKDAIANGATTDVDPKTGEVKVIPPATGHSIARSAYEARKQNRKNRKK